MVRVIEGKTAWNWSEGKQKLLWVSGRFELSRERVTGSKSKITINVWRKSRANRFRFKLARDREIGSQLYLQRFHESTLMKLLEIGTTQDIYMNYEPWRWLRNFMSRFLKRHLHISHDAPPLPPKILHNLCLLFFLGLQPSQEKLKTMLMKNLGEGENKVHYGKCASGVLRKRKKIITSPCCHGYADL